MLTVTVYSTGPSCMRCTLTKKALAKEGVPFVEVDVRENPDARAYITEDLGYSEAPVCIVEDGTGEDHWSGFRPDNIKRVAKRLFVDLVGSDTRGVMGGVYGSRSPRIRSANH